MFSHRPRPHQRAPSPSPVIQTPGVQKPQGPLKSDLFYEWRIFLCFCPSLQHLAKGHSPISQSSSRLRKGPFGWSSENPGYFRFPPLGLYRVILTGNSWGLPLCWSARQPLRTRGYWAGDSCLSKLKCAVKAKYHQANKKECKISY